jgi:hypothetical protein
MALRLLELNVQEKHVHDIVALRKENNIPNYWQTCGCESSIIFKKIMHVESTGKLLTILEIGTGNTEVIIGAMVIAPLLGPNVALALAATLGDSITSEPETLSSASSAALKPSRAGGLEPSAPGHADHEHLHRSPRDVD